MKIWSWDERRPGVTFRNTDRVLCPRKYKRTSSYHNDFANATPSRFCGLLIRSRHANVFLALPG